MLHPPDRCNCLQDAMLRSAARSAFLCACLPIHPEADILSSLRHQEAFEPRHLQELYNQNPISRPDLELLAGLVLQTPVPPQPHGFRNSSLSWAATCAGYIL
jgi:hypothetical protein